MVSGEWEVRAALRPIRLSLRAVSGAEPQAQGYERSPSTSLGAVSLSNRRMATVNRELGNREQKRNSLSLSEGGADEQKDLEAIGLFIWLCKARN